VSFARTYFRKRNAVEKEIRSLCTALLERVDWAWMIRQDMKILHGWTPENGIIPHIYGATAKRCCSICRALAPKNRPAPAAVWTSLMDGVKAEKFGGKPYIAMPGTPLFCYQYPHCWIDFRGIAMIPIVGSASITSKTVFGRRRLNTATPWTIPTLARIRRTRLGSDCL